MTVSFKIFPFFYSTTIPPRSHESLATPLNLRRINFEFLGPGDIRPLNASLASQSGMSLDGNSNECKLIHLDILKLPFFYVVNFFRLHFPFLDHLTGSSRRLNKGRKALEEWEINASDVVYHRKIGSGSFGTVFKGTYFGKNEHQGSFRKNFFCRQCCYQKVERWKPGSRIAQSLQERSGRVEEHQARECVELYGLDTRAGVGDRDAVV